MYAEERRRIIRTNSKSKESLNRTGGGEFDVARLSATEEIFLATIFPVGPAVGMIPGVRQFGVQHDQTYPAPYPYISHDSEINAGIARSDSPTPVMRISVPDHGTPHYHTQTISAEEFLPRWNFETPATGGFGYLERQPSAGNELIRRRLFPSEVPIVRSTSHGLMIG